MSRPASAMHGHAGTPRAARGRSAVWVALVVGVLSCAGAVIYAGQGAAEVAYRLIVEGAIILFWLAAAAGWGAWPVRWVLTPRKWAATKSSAGASERSLGGGLQGSESSGNPLYNSTIILTTAAAVGLGVMSLMLLALGLAGQLSMLVAIALLVVGVVLGVGCLLRWRRDPAPSAEPPVDDRWHWLWLTVVPVLSLALVAAYVPPGLLWKPEEPHGYDVVEYHFQVPRQWHQTGQIEPLDHNVFSYFPFAVEMHYLLAMHLRGGAWQGMYLAQLMHLAMVALSVIAACGFANPLARRRRIATIAALAGATVPWLGLLAPIGFNEGGLLLYGTLAMGWISVCVGRALPAGEQGPSASRTSSLDSGPHPKPLPDYQEKGPEIRLFSLAGLCAGFACGVKLTAVPLLLLAIPVVAFLLMVRRSPRLAFTATATFVVVGLIAFSPWLIRNFAWTGNPVFPEGRAVFGDGPFSDVQADRWQKAHAAQPNQQSVIGRLSALADQVLLNWQFGWILMPLAVAALAMNWRSPVSRLLAGLLVIQALFWLGLTHLQGRFFVLAIPVGVLAIAAADWDFGRRRGGRLISATLAIVVVVVGLVNWWQVHRRLAFKLYEERGMGIDVALGQTDISWITAGSIEGFPLNEPSARLLLVGDAQAFWYPLPPSRLAYQTVFDLDTSGDRSIIEAIDRRGWRHDGNIWLLIAPMELDRYEQTYQPFPKIPDDWRLSPQWQAGVPFLVPPVQASRWTKGG